MGTTIPVFQYFLSDLFDAFGPTMTKEEQMEKVEFTVMIISIMAGGMWILGYIYWTLLSTVSLRVSRRIKESYLTAILNQECAWFDQVNYTELSARISRESMAI